ncbi:hypothetical protein BKA65DRAFT_557333 [Rhexocercosporidium sp. MPI-PUGE-AT-0058]|nr:hypothetical protein BKA65DRAFT_557333 [Rhexocercosporidium sp. MPI-PUGE-AT-0058]
MRTIRSRMRMQPEWYRWSNLEEYVAYGWSLLRRIFFERPAVWVLNLYDRHWPSSFRRIPDVHEMARRGIIGGESLLDAPVALPKTRKRALTHPLPPMESRSMPFNLRRSRQRTHEQVQSPFLAKLPIEIREMIYEEILGGGDRRLVHILRKDRRLGHWRCRLQDGEEVCDQQDRRCVEGWLSYKSKVWHLDRNGLLDLVTDGGLLPLLMTCRAIYSEAVPILYSKNVFHFYDPGDIRHFARTILPHRLNAVQSIMIDWERMFSIFNRNNGIPKQDDEELMAWRETWEVIARMSGLMDVKVVLKPHRFHVTRARRRRMCKELMGIHGLRTFEVVIPWDDETDWSFAASAPFRVVRGPMREQMWT